MALAATTLSALGWAQERGLQVNAQALGATGWQARFERLGEADRLWAPGAAAPLLGPQSLRLLGDLPLHALGFGLSPGGLRLTGGLLVQLRAGGVPGTSSDPLPTQPYAGIGYSSSSALGSLGHPWGRLGFSADLGLAAGGLGVTLGNRGSHVLGMGIEGSPRDLRLVPMVRLGMNLAF